MALKSSADGWLVGQVSGSRELYMLFDAKYTNLSEVHQEMLALKKIQVHAMPRNSAAQFGRAIRRNYSDARLNPPR